MKPLLVLVLDGDSERRQEIMTLLRQAGHQVVTESIAAGETIQPGNYDLLVLDLDLPSLDSAALRQAISSAAPTAPDSLQDAERRHLALMLRHTSGNKRKAAHLLGISRSTLLNKVRKYGLEG
jgi:Fis family transcriptional regulator, factor for inversion stimulation protein